MSNSESLRVRSLQGGTGLIRSLPSAVGVRRILNRLQPPPPPTHTRTHTRGAVGYNTTIKRKTERYYGNCRSKRYVCCFVMGCWRAWRSRHSPTKPPLRQVVLDSHYDDRRLIHPSTQDSIIGTSRLLMCCGRDLYAIPNANIVRVMPYSIPGKCPTRLCHWSVPHSAHVIVIRSAHGDNFWCCRFAEDRSHVNVIPFPIVKQMLRVMQQKQVVNQTSLLEFQPSGRKFDVPGHCWSDTTHAPTQSAR